MTVLKCLNKLLDKYRRTILDKHHQEYQNIETANQLYSACFAKPNRTTLLTASIPSHYHQHYQHYQHYQQQQHHQSIRVAIKRANKSSSSVCGSCRRNETFFCKCCGKQINRSVVRRNGSKKLHLTNELMRRSSQFKINLPKRKEPAATAAATDKTGKQTNYLKKSQAMINIKRIYNKEFKSSLSSSCVERSSNILNCFPSSPIPLY